VCTGAGLASNRSRPGAVSLDGSDVHNSRTRHIIHRAAALLGAALVVVAARLILGPWPTAIAVAAAGLWWGLRAWFRIETRTRPAKARAPQLVHAARSPAGGHVAFARALAVAAAAYLAECEREADRP
jgi:hypothetical protein